MIKNIGKITCYLKSTQKTVHFPNFYLSKFQSQQLKLKEQERQLRELRLQKQLLQQASITSGSDQIKKLFSRVFKKPYESEAILNLRNQINDLRNELEEVVIESDKKWQEPRKLIKEIRQDTVEEFLTHFIHLQEIIGKTDKLNTQSAELSEGCTLTYRMMLSILQKNGAQYFEPHTNQKFNFQLHQTVDQYDDNSQIEEMLTRGWKIKDKVIKKSVVKIKEK